MQLMNKIYDSFRVAFVGIRFAMKERNIRIHLAIGSIVVALSFAYSIALWEWCVIVLAMGLVLGLELLNTAIEQLSNVVRDQNSMDQSSTKIPRDVAAGAVLLASISSAIVGLLIFLPKIFA